MPFVFKFLIIGVPCFGVPIRLALISWLPVVDAFFSMETPIATGTQQSPMGASRSQESQSPKHQAAVNHIINLPYTNPKPT